MSVSGGAPVRVGIDGFNLALPRGTGVATYGRTLSCALRNMGYGVDILFGLHINRPSRNLPQDVMFFDRLANPWMRRPPGAGSPRWIREVLSNTIGRKAVPVPGDGRVITRHLTDRLPAYDRLYNLDGLFEVARRHFKRSGSFLKIRMRDPPAIMHWTYPLPIRLLGARNVYTLHDLVPLLLPYTTLDNKPEYARLVRGCIRWGDHICTVSEASRVDILSCLPVPPEFVTNTYQAAEAVAPAVPDDMLDSWLSGLFGLKRGEYFLFSAALEPKKNYMRMIEAFLSSGIQRPLVMTGGRSWCPDNEPTLAGEGTVAGDRIRLLDYIPAAWLASLVRGARAVFFPSLYEGFGLPVLEAMQAGTPVLTSNTSSLPEIAGDAAMMVDPYNTAAMAAAMRRLDADAALRARLSAAGRAQAEKFSLTAYQQRLTRLYASVLRRQPSAGFVSAASRAPARTWDVQAGVR